MENKIRTFSPNNNPTDRFFKEMYFPMLLESKGELILSFKSGYNYDLEILITFDGKSGLLKGGIVRHEIKEWEFFIQDATEIIGFEDNKPEFDSLRDISTKVVKDNIKLINEILSKPMTGECEWDKHFDFSEIDNILKKELIENF